MRICIPGLRISLLAGISLSSFASAQTTWIVDESGAPGTHFGDLPAAVAAAADGDVLRVRAGTYSPFTLRDKGLRIIGDDSAQVFVSRPGFVSLGPIRADQRIWIEGVSFAMSLDQSTGTPPSFFVRDALGPVVLRDASFGLAIVPPNTFSRVTIQRCAMVLLEDVVITPSVSSFWVGSPVHGVHATASNVHVSTSTIHGANSGGHLALAVGGHGIAVEGGTLLVAASSIYGGTGAWGCALTGRPSGDGGPALFARNGAEVFVYGRGNSHDIEGGSAGGDCNPARPPSGTGGAGVEVDDASVSFDGCEPLGGAGAVSGPASITRNGASLRVGPTSLAPVAAILGDPRPGSPIGLRLEAEPGGAALLALSFEHRFTPLGGTVVGDLLVSPPFLALLGPLDLASSSWEMTTTMPLEWPVDVPLVAQFLVLQNARLFASNTVAILVRS